MPACPLHRHKHDLCNDDSLHPGWSTTKNERDDNFHGGCLWNLHMTKLANVSVRSRFMHGHRFLWMAKWICATANSTNWLLSPEGNCFVRVVDNLNTFPTRDTDSKHETRYVRVSSVKLPLSGTVPCNYYYIKAHKSHSLDTGIVTATFCTYLHRI